LLCRACYKKIREKVLEEANTINFECVVEISRERAITKEACRFLMATEKQKLPELNAYHHAEVAPASKLGSSRTRNPASGGWC
jgi:hypothetical protein